MWHEIETEGYPYSFDEYMSVLRGEGDVELLKDYLITDGEDYFIGFWRPDAHTWDNSNFGWVRSNFNGKHSRELANITHWVELPELPNMKED